VSRIADAAYGDKPYPESPGFKEGTTSRDAARAILSRAETLRHLVMAEITAAGRSGLSADQVAARLGESVLSIRPRLSELSKPVPPRLPLIVPTGERRTNDSGMKAKVWRAA
jgi:hypothetical protein